MGKAWYEDQGKYLTKLNTFEDFGSAAAFLADNKISAPGVLAGVGRSAGGLLIGAVANMYPDRFRCLVADVPFVDALNTVDDFTTIAHDKRAEALLIEPLFLMLILRSSSVDARSHHSTHRDRVGGMVRKSFALVMIL
jgi:hypothetical protein